MSEVQHSSRQFLSNPETTKTTRSRFSPELVETTTRSNKNGEVTKQEGPKAKPRRKFNVEPVEEIPKSHRGSPLLRIDNTETLSSTDPLKEDTPKEKSHRKFKVELIE